MADDMANGGTGTTREEIHDASSRILVLSQRTATLESAVGDVRRELSNSVQGINQAIGAMSSKVDERFNSLASAMAERNKTQWPVIWSAIGVSFAVLAYFVTQALEPIKSNQARFEQTVVQLSTETNRTIEALTAKSVTRDELDWRAARGAEDRTRTEAAIADLRASDVSRAEWMERNRARDSEITELSRRIDEVRQQMGSVYGTRDVLLDLRERLDRLERDRLIPRTRMPAPS